ncbi:alpha/beta hydrolase [Labilibacter marinus]|uniref:alpha/beta hydrolase n=1 Tax=Labilibacter marinus TaxID=1477105 RepID=UPI00083769AA|nr:alpha/beta hydrolase [Labilibacter marinus]
MKKIFLSFCIALLFSFSAIAQNEVSLNTSKGDLKGTLLIPEKAKQPPLVIIIAGSGPTDRNGNNPMMMNNSLKMLAEGLMDKGIASLRFDKRGVAASKDAVITEKDLRFEDFVKDASAWVDKYKSDERFGDILIAGHSEGSLIGMLSAQNKEVDKFISLAGIGGMASNTISKQVASQAPMLSAQVDTILVDLENGQTVDSIPPMLFNLFRASVQPYLISWFKYNPSKELAKLNKPVLIVQGTTDLQVDVKDAEMLYQAQPKAQIAIIEGMNHILKPAELDRMKNMQTYSKANLALHPELLPIIVSFVLN